RRRHTRSKRDWSSDVCSSDLLKKSNLQNGILTYSRKKTGQRLTILWEELMQEIVDKYKDDSSEYLLPILRYCDINDRKQYKLRADRKSVVKGKNEKKGGRRMS